MILCFIFGFFISSFFAFDSIAVGSVPVIAMIIFVVSGSMGVIRRINHKKKLEKSVKEKNIYEQELKILKNDAVLCWLPYDYRDSTAFACLFSYINNMRASNLEQAIHLYEMEKIQQNLKMIFGVDK